MLLLHFGSQLPPETFRPLRFRTTFNNRYCRIISFSTPEIPIRKEHGVPVYAMIKA